MEKSISPIGHGEHLPCRGKAEGDGHVEQELQPQVRKHDRTKGGERNEDHQGGKHGQEEKLEAAPSALKAVNAFTMLPFPRQNEDFRMSSSVALSPASSASISPDLNT